MSTKRYFYAVDLEKHAEYRGLWVSRFPRKERDKWVSLDPRYRRPLSSRSKAVRWAFAHRTFYNITEVELVPEKFFS